MSNAEPQFASSDEQRWVMPEAEFRKLLRRADFEFTEDYFLSVLRNPRNKMNTYWSIIALRQIGTEKSIPALKEALSSRTVDIAIVAMTSLAFVADRAGTDTYIDALTGTWYRHKWAALFSLQVTCDPLSFPAMAVWVKKKTREIKSGRMEYQLALELAVYLHRLGKTVPAADELLRELTPDLKLLHEASDFGIPNYVRGEVVRRILGIQSVQ